jgi:hypothetical protein
MEDAEIPVLLNESPAPQYTILLSHGAGAPMQHYFLKEIADAISKLNGHVIRFNFPYISSGRRSPGSPKPNIVAIGSMIDYAKTKYPDLPLFISGKSYGGRMSSHWIAENSNDDRIKGLIYFGFPLHAPGRDSKDRAAHLYGIKMPQLFLQGTNDKLANFDLINEVVKDCEYATLVEIPFGDHSFKVPKKTGMTSEDVIKKLSDATNKWIRKQL